MVSRKARCNRVSRKEEVSLLCSMALLASSRLAEFDAAPFINIFEAAVDQLIPLRNQVSARATEHEAIVSKAERQYTSKLKELKENFEVCSHASASKAQLIVYRPYLHPSTV